MSRSVSVRLTAVVGAIAFTAAACGGGSSKKAAETTTTTAAAESTTETGVTTTAPAAESTSTTAATTAGTGKTTATKAATTVKSSTKKAFTTSPPPTVQGLAQATTTAPTTPSEPIQPGGTLTVLFHTESNGFDPTKGVGNASGNDMQRMFQVYDALVYQDPPTGSVVPETAQSMTSADAKVWTLKLRDGIKFTDGTPYDANAVKFNWDRHADATNGSQWAATFKTFTFQVVDPLTVQITLNSPNSQFPRVISRQLAYIASPAAIQAAGPGTAYNNAKPVGAGPFMLQSWTRDSEMVLVRNPSYWNAPRPYLDKLDFKVITDPTQRDNTFKSGNGDLSEGTQLTINDMAKNFPVYASPSINTGGIGMQENHAPFNDRNVRKAMALAFDVDQYNSVVNANVFETAHTAFTANYPYTDPAIAWPKPDLAAAQKLVDDYVANVNGGKDITFTYSFLSPANDTGAQLLQAQLQRLNHVKVNLKGETQNQLVADLIAKNNDMTAMGYVGVDPESDFTEDMLCKGSRQFYSYCNTEVDRLVLDSRQTLDTAKRNQDLKDIQKIVIDDAMYIPFQHYSELFVYRNNVKNLSTFDDGGLLLDRMWLKTH